MHGDLDVLLRAWGVYYGEQSRPEAPRGQRTDVHPLARAMQFAPGKRDRRRAQGRGGLGRRTLMANAVGIKGLHVVPGEYVDPVPARETRSMYYQPEMPVPPALQQVEQAVRVLEQHDLVRGTCLRAQYCVPGDRAAKALWATAQLRKVSRSAEVSIAKLANEVAFARVWVAARLAVALGT